MLCSAPLPHWPLKSLFGEHQNADWVEAGGRTLGSWTKGRVLHSASRRSTLHSGATLTGNQWEEACRAPGPRPVGGSASPGPQTLGWFGMPRVPRPTHSSASPRPQTCGWLSMPQNTGDFNSAMNGSAGHTFSLNSANSLLLCFNSGLPVFLTL